MNDRLTRFLLLAAASLCAAIFWALVWKYIGAL